jgi:hypothetical protein
MKECQYETLARRLKLKMNMRAKSLSGLVFFAHLRVLDTVRPLDITDNFYDMCGIPNSGDLNSRGSDDSPKEECDEAPSEPDDETTVVMHLSGLENPTGYYHLDAMIYFLFRCCRLLRCYLSDLPDRCISFGQ